MLGLAPCPPFTNHEDDVVPGKLSSQRYIYSDNDWGHLGPMNAVAADGRIVGVRVRVGVRLRGLVAGRAGG